MSPKDTNLTVFLADVSGAGMDPAAQAPVEAVDPVPVPVAVAGAVDPVVAAALEVLVRSRPWHVRRASQRGSDEVTQADRMRLAYEVRVDPDMPRGGRFWRGMAGVVGRPELAAGWQERLNGLMALTLEVLDRPDLGPSWEEFENVRRVRDLIRRGGVLAGEVGEVGVVEVGVNGFDRVVAETRGPGYGPATSVDRVRLVGKVIPRAKRWFRAVTMDSVRSAHWALLVDEMRGAKSLELHSWGAMSWGGALTGWVVLFVDPAVAADEAEVEAARAWAKGMAFPDGGVKLAVYGGPGGGGSAAGVGWNGRQFGPGEVAAAMHVLYKDTRWNGRFAHLARLELYGAEAVDSGGLRDAGFAEFKNPSEPWLADFLYRYGLLGAEREVVNGRTVAVSVWNPHDRNFVFDLASWDVLWVRGRVLGSSAAPDLGPFGESAEPTLVVGGRGEEIPDAVVQQSWAHFGEPLVRPEAPHPRFIVHRPELVRSVKTGLVEVGYYAEMPEDGVVLMLPDGLNPDLEAAYRATAAARRPAEGEAWVYVAPGRDEDQAALRFDHYRRVFEDRTDTEIREMVARELDADLDRRVVRAMDQTLTRLPSGRDKVVRLVVPAKWAGFAWAARYAAITVTVETATIPATAGVPVETRHRPRDSRCPGRTRRRHRPRRGRRCGHHDGGRGGWEFVPAAADGTPDVVGRVEDARGQRGQG